MSLYEIEFTLTGWGQALVEADSQEEAEDKAREWSVIPLSEACREWSYEDITSVKEIT